MICLLTEHRIVLSQAEQFDVLDFTKRLLKTYFRLSYLMEKYMGLVKVHLYIKPPSLKSKQLKVRLSLDTQYMTNSTLVSPFKMEYG